MHCFSYSKIVRSGLLIGVFTPIIFPKMRMQTAEYGLYISLYMYLTIP